MNLEAGGHKHFQGTILAFKDTMNTLLPPSPQHKRCSNMSHAGYTTLLSVKK